TAPDRTAAGVGLLVFLRRRPVRVRLVLEGGISGTIAGVTAVNFQIVGSEGDRHALDSSTANPAALPHKPVTCYRIICNLLILCGSPRETKGISRFGDTGKSIDSKWA